MSRAGMAIDAREVKLIDGLVTAVDGTDPEQFLDYCTVGSLWIVSIRTATVQATLRSRRPLSTFDEAVCTCLTLELERPVPVEPGLRFRLVADSTATIKAAGIVRPWAKPRKKESQGSTQADS